MGRAGRAARRDLLGGRLAGRGAGVVITPGDVSGAGTQRAARGGQRPAGWKLASMRAAVLGRRSDRAACSRCCGRRSGGAVLAHRRTLLDAGGGARSARPRPQSAYTTSIGDAGGRLGADHRVGARVPGAQGDRSAGGERRGPAEAVIADATPRRYRSDRLAEALARPERFLGLHWFNPAHLIPLVEVVLDRSDRGCGRRAGRRR